MDSTEQLSYILPTLSSVVDRIYQHELPNRTPCERFTVHDVIDHMIVLGGTFAYQFRGEEPPTIEAPGVYGWVPAPEFRQTMDDLLAAVKSPGALDRTIDTPMGPMPGETFARRVAFDGLVHGWDLASSTGNRFELPSGVVDAVETFAHAALTDDMRDGDTFKDAKAAPPGATGIERIAAFSGRAV